MKFKITYILFFFTLLGLAQDGARGSRGTAVASAKSGVKRALVIGISKYKASELNLNYADKDAELFRDYLIKIDSIPEKNLTYLTNEDATSFNISNALSKLIENTNEGDKVYLFFAGHGDVVDQDSVEEKIGFLLAHDVNKEREYYGTQGVVPFKDINTTVNSIANKNAKIVLVLDACKSGFLYLDGSQRNLETMNNTFENSTKLLSCKPNQLSYESSNETSNIGQGFFTYYLVLGLMGAADNLVQDFNLQSFELQSFLDTNVAAATANKQSPVVKTTKSTEILKKVNSTDKSDALLQIQNSTAIKTLLANRNDTYNAESTFKDNDGIIEKFNKALQSKNYYGSESSAQEIIKNAESDSSVSEELVQNLKDNLVNALSLEAQTLINTYISNSKNLPSGNVFLEHAKYLDICLSYMNKNDFMYDRFLCSKLFLEAYSTIKLQRFDKYNEAKEKLQSALKIEQKAAYIYNALGIIMNDLEYYEEALKNYKKANELIPTWSFPLNNIGSNYLDINNYENAIDFYTKASKMKFAQKTSYNNIGVVYDRMGRFKDSETFYLKVGEVDGNFLDITLRNLAKVYNSRGNLKQAYDYFEKAYQQDSTNITTLTEYGEFLIDEALNPARGELLVNRAIELAPYQSDGYRELADCYRRFKRETKFYLKADSLYQKAIELNPHDTWAYAGRAWNYKKLDKSNEEIEQQFLKGIKANPQKASAYYYLGNYYSEVDKKEEFYKKAIAQDSFYMPAYKSLVKVYNDNKTYTESFSLLEGVTQWNSKSPDIYNLIGNTYFEQNDFQNATVNYQKAITLDSTYANGLVNLAYCELKNKNYESSFQYFLKSFKANPYKLKLNDYAQYFLFEARTSKDDKLKLYELAYKLESNAETKYLLAKHYYLNDKSDLAETLLTDVNFQELSRSWKIQYLKLLILLNFESESIKKANQLNDELKKVNPKNDTILNVLLLYFNKDKKAAKEAIKNINPYFLEDKQLLKNYNSTIVEIIKSLRL